MNRNTPPKSPRVADRRNESGVALLVAVFVLMLVGLAAISSIQSSEDESTAGGRSRSAVAALYQADAGIALAFNRVQQTPPNIDPIDLDLGYGRSVQSRARADTGAQPLAEAGTGLPPDGYQIADGSGDGYYSILYLVNVTALNGTQAVAEIEAMVGALAAE